MEEGKSGKGGHGKMNLRTDNVWAGEGLLEKEEAVKCFSGDE